MPVRNGSLLKAKEYWIDDRICMRVPTVEEILDFGATRYFNLVYTLYATPYELMGQLDAMGIDYEKVPEYDLFCFAFLGMKAEDASMVFTNVEPGKYKLCPDKENNRNVLVHAETGDRIAPEDADMIASFLRRIHCVEKCRKKAGNSAMKKYLLEKARKKLNSAKARKQDEDFMENMLVCLLNTSEFAAKSIEDAYAMNLYFFNRSMRQINKKIDYDHICAGIYAGTIDSKKINMQKIHWMNLDGK